MSADNVLQEIVKQRLRDVEADRRVVTLEQLQRNAAGRVHRSLKRRLEQGQGRGACVIAEVKKASPSAGVLCPDYDPAAIARQYAAAGACAISVLTEPHRFLGNISHLQAVRAVVDLPILRKDFTCDPYQVWEAGAWGADVVLLIVAALSAGQLAELNALARQLGLDVIVEVHDEDELALALTCPDAIIGVNSRNLKTLKTDLGVARRLAAFIPRERLAIAESGIRTRAEIEELGALGYRGFLVGESLLKSGTPGAKLRELMGT